MYTKGRLFKDRVRMPVRHRFQYNPPPLVAEKTKLSPSQNLKEIAFFYVQLSKCQDALNSALKSISLLTYALCVREPKTNILSLRDSDKRSKNLTLLRVLLKTYLMSEALVVAESSLKQPLGSHRTHSVARHACSHLSCPLLYRRLAPLKETSSQWARTCSQLPSQTSMIPH